MPLFVLSLLSSSLVSITRVIGTNSWVFNRYCHYLLLGAMQFDSVVSLHRVEAVLGGRSFSYWPGSLLFPFCAVRV